MNTRKGLQFASLYSSQLCVYCGGLADTRDHTPPRCFLRSPLPSTANLITLPACKTCNSTFSFDENVTKAIMAIVSDQPDLAAERQPAGKVFRAIQRDRRLQALLEACQQTNGEIRVTAEVSECFVRAFTKTVQGVYFGLYERVLPKDEVEVLFVRDQRQGSPEDVVDQIRPPRFREVTGDVWPELTPSGWMVRDPIYVVELKPKDSVGPPVQKMFRMARDVPVEWVDFQPGVFRFSFVKAEDGRAVCVLDLWKTLIVAVATPWPDSRGPIRRGRKNPFSRERA